MANKNKGSTTGGIFSKFYEDLYNRLDKEKKEKLYKERQEKVRTATVYKEFFEKMQKR